MSKVLSEKTFRSGNPILISSPSDFILQQPVRWMHILETSTPDELLSGREFVLTTATFLDDLSDNLDECAVAAEQFLDSLETKSAVAVAAEVLDDRKTVGEALKRAANRRLLPVYIFTKKIRFIELMQSIHENIATTRLQEIESDRKIHETFTSLAIETASADAIVEKASKLLEQEVQWHPASIESPQMQRPDVMHPVVAGDEVLGHLATHHLSDRDHALIQTVLERAGQAMTISVLSRRSQQEMTRATASSLFYQLRNGTTLSDEEVQWRLNEIFDVRPLPISSWSPNVFRMWADSAREDQLNLWSGIFLDVVSEIGRETKQPLFAARSELGVVDALLPITSQKKIDDLINTISLRFLARVQNKCEVVAGVALPAASAKEAAALLNQATQIAKAAQSYRNTERVSSLVFRAQDLGLRGLLATLQEHQQLVPFIAGELMGLVRASKTQAAFEKEIEFLEQVIAQQNKADLARRLKVSRTALYARIQRLETRLGYGLEDSAEQRTATHLALLAYQLAPEKTFRLLSA